MENDPGEPECVWPVAYLNIHRTGDTQSSFRLPIEANAEFDLGRDQFDEALGFKDYTVSKHHIRFHCVTYGDESVATIAPMIYARTLSRLGVRLLQKAADGSSSTLFLQSGQPPVLLNHGDTLQLSSNVVMEYHDLTKGDDDDDDDDDDGDEQNQLGDLVTAEARRFESQYSILPRALGAGGFASVFLATNVKTRRQVACKIVRVPEKPPVPTLSDWETQPGHQSVARETIARIVGHREKCQKMRREFELLKGIDHPNIIRLEKAIYTTDHIYIFQELLSGGDLLSYLERKDGLDEPETAVIIFQVLKAIEHLHSQGIVHRDIKPENILLTSWRKGSRIVLTDFGQARKLVEEDVAAKRANAAVRMMSLVGTSGYAAPEVYLKRKRLDTDSDHGYDETIDVWSVGCLAGTLVTNQLLFDRDRSHDTERPQSGDGISEPNAFDLTFLDTSSEWQATSRQCKSFIKACVSVDVSQRLTVAQALRHPWIAHPSFAQAMQAEYARAVADWSPRSNVSKATDIVEYAKDPSPNVKALVPAYGARLHEEVRSHHFPSQMPIFPSQFKPLSFAAYTERHSHTPLSPIDEMAPKPQKVLKGNLDLANQRLSGSAFQSTASKKRPADDGISNLSIQDFAPPQTYQASQIAQDPPEEQSSWNIRLAESMYPEEPSGKGHNPFLHKRPRM